MLRLRLDELPGPLPLALPHAGPGLEYILRKPKRPFLYGVIVEQFEAFLARQAARERPVRRLCAQLLTHGC